MSVVTDRKIAASAGDSPFEVIRNINQLNPFTFGANLENEVLTLNHSGSTWSDKNNFEGGTYSVRFNISNNTNAGTFIIRQYIPVTNEQNTIIIRERIEANTSSVIDTTFEVEYPMAEVTFQYYNQGAFEYVVSDFSIEKLSGTSTGGTEPTEAIAFVPDVVSFSDYFPFGSYLPGRHGNSGDYRYGFNGMETDNELKGEGNSYDFGARMFDPRIGRWFATDLLEHEYPNVTPYGISLNNPIKFLDKDGNVVVDENGNEVKVTVSQNEDGTIKATYEFVANTSEEAKKNFFENGGRVIDTAIKIEEGRDVVEKAIKSKDKILITITSKDNISVTHKDGKRITKGTLGSTNASHKFIRKKVNGKTVSSTKVFHRINVKIFEGSISTIEEKLGAKNPTHGLTKDQKLAATGIHELTHATTDAEAVKAGRGIPTGSKEHEPAKNSGDRAVNQFKQLNTIKENKAVINN